MLASPGEPLRLANGTMIDPATGKVIKEQRKMIEVPANSAAQRQVARTKRKLADLPAPPKQLNALSAVLMYTMVGLSDDDISLATGMSSDQISRVRDLDAYKQLSEHVTTSIVEQDTGSVRDVIATHAKTAVSKVVELMDSEDEKVALTAAKDILDRGGHRPADIVEHKHSMDGGLTIRFIKEDRTETVPILELEVDHGDST